jgi:hypothetical protein
VVHTALLEPADRWAAVLAKLTRRSTGDRADERLQALKLAVETATGRVAVR